MKPPTPGAFLATALNHGHVWPISLTGTEVHHLGWNPSVAKKVPDVIKCPSVRGRLGLVKPSHVILGYRSISVLVTVLERHVSTCLNLIWPQWPKCVIWSVYNYTWSIRHRLWNSCGVGSNPTRRLPGSSLPAMAIRACTILSTDSLSPLQRLGYCLSPDDGENRFRCFIISTTPLALAGFSSIMPCGTLSFKDTP